MIDKSRLIQESQHLVSALYELGAQPHEEIAETRIETFIETNLNQIDAPMSPNDLKDEYELLLNDVLLSIKEKARKALVDIINETYSEIYYGG